MRIPRIPRFAPSRAFADAANAQPGLYEDATEDRLGFWAEEARRLHWDRPWSQVLDSSRAPYVRWFTDGRLNVAYNCVDRHVDTGHGDQVAIHWVGEPGDTRTLTYAELRDEVCRAANALTSLGLRAADRVAIHLPRIPEAVISMLACARLGLPHNVITTDAVQDVGASVVITADGGYQQGSAHPFKAMIDATTGPEVRHVLVVRRTGTPVNWTPGRDLWWHDLVDAQSTVHTPQAFDAEHPLFILHTPDSAGKPKGILHTTGGYLTQVAYTHHMVFDHQPDTDVYWCTADLGSISGHSYAVYGPLANRATQVIYEGTLDTPHRDRWWEIIEKYQVSVLYTESAAIRTVMNWGAALPAGHDLSSLRLLGAAGEPCNTETWLWFWEHIGGGGCPVVDTWSQPETGAIMISPLPGVTLCKPGAAMAAVPGVCADVVDERGLSVRDGGRGLLVIIEPWPAMLRGVWGDDRRFRETYWCAYGDLGYYLAGDGGRRDEEGSIWVLGRADDAMLLDLILSGRPVILR